MTDAADISKYQATHVGGDVYQDNIDWHTYWANHKGVIIGTGDGYYQSNVWDDQVFNSYSAKPEDKFLHLYNFIRFKQMTGTQASEVFRDRWNHVDGRASFYWIDVEDDAVSGLSANQMLDWLADLEAGLNNYGIPHGIYTAYWWWSYYVAFSRRFSHMPLWDADYRATNVYRDYGWPESQRAIRQYTSTGYAAGIGQGVDQNYVFWIPGGGEEMGMTPEEKARVDNMEDNINFLVDMCARNGVYRDDVIGGEKMFGQEAYEYVRERMAAQQVSFYLHDQELYDDTHEHSDGGGASGVSEQRAREIAIEEAQKVRYQ